jgi:folylpolyglutamate synthase/dihydropteroate synthase
MTAFIASFQQQYPGSRPCVLIAMKQDKTYETVVPLLTALSDHIIVTSFNDVQDLPVTSINAAHLARAFEKAGVRRVECVPDRYNALNRSLNAPESTVIVTGSLYLLRGIGDQLI